MSDHDVRYADDARAALARGIDRMTRLLRPTIGPVPRTVAAARIAGGGTPEILDHSATIMARTLRIECPFESIGAKIVREMVTQLHDTVGDGGATAAVLTDRLVKEGYRYVAAGGNPIMLRRGIEHGMTVVRDYLRAQARPLESPLDITRIVAGTVRDPEIADALGKIMDTVGADGAVLIEDSRATGTEHEYIEGLRWNEGFVSHFLLRPGEHETRLIHPRILATDMQIKTAGDIVSVLEACRASGGRSLFMIAPGVSDAALGVLAVNRERKVLDQAIAVRAPGLGAQRDRILEDIAIVTGGQAVLKGAGRSLSDVKPADLGRARQAWANRFVFGILGGHGSREAVRQRIAEARAELRVPNQQDYVREKVRERLAKLAGSAAIIRVGAPTRTAQQDLKRRVRAAVQTARAALENGVVPGGGAAYLACARALRDLECSGEEGIGVTILMRALQEPARAIAENSGREPGPLVHEALHGRAGQVFDASALRWVDPWDAGILDSASVAIAAADAGVSAGTVALTTAVLIRRSGIHGR